MMRFRRASRPIIVDGDRPASRRASEGYLQARGRRPGQQYHTVLPSLDGKTPLRVSYAKL